MGEMILDIRHLSKAFGSHRVLQDIDFTVNKGDVISVIGASGSGKSTLLRCINLLETPNSGEILYRGENVLTGNMKPHTYRSRVGMVFQSFNLVDTLDVAANIELPVRLDHGRPDAARLAALVAKLGLVGLEARHPDALSGGERQRVAIARALYAEPDVILADEPTGNLDVAAAKSLCDIFRVLHRDEKSAILLVTHDPVVASAADRVHFLKDGKIAASHDTPNHDPAEISRLYLETYK